MLSFDKDTIFLDDQKEAVVTTPLSENKLLTTENVTISDGVHKRAEKIKTNEEVEKGIGKTEDTKESLFKIRWNNSDKFEGQSKGSTGWFNLDHD